MGPGVEAFVSTESGFEDASVEVGTGGGGGSMTKGAGDGLEMGSGRDGIESSADEVSIVMCFVFGGE